MTPRQLSNFSNPASCSALEERISNGDFRAIARAITLIEIEQPGYFEFLKSLSLNRDIPVIGFTGPPGAGKSSVINCLLSEISKRKEKVAVVAVDPSSPFNFGALLGDRIRMNEHENRDNVFIRSLASRGALGGLAKKTFEIVDLLRSAPFDWIFVETVGVGQSEVEIAGLADLTVVTLVPNSGDDIQMLKAGLMEIADIFILNKADMPGAESLHKFLALHLHQADLEIPIHKTIATENEGFASLPDLFKQTQASPGNVERRLTITAQRALQMIKDYRTSDIKPEFLLEKIRTESAKSDFNLYRFLEKDWFV